MQAHDDPFIALASESLVDDFSALEQRAMSALPVASAVTAPAVGRLLGFDLLDQPLVGDMALCPGQVISARSTVALKRSMVGEQVLVQFEGGDARLPIVTGVLRKASLRAEPLATSTVTVQADGERHLIEAEREIVLRCGDASITLTRAGKVIIKGNYILSRASGYNKIKGAAIDIN
jgi:Domain of unknown function (DUF6484)